MSFIASGEGTGTEWRTAPDAANYIDMVRKIQQFADDTNHGVGSNTDITLVPAADGSGYVVGDFVRVADGNGDASGVAVHPSAHTDGAGADNTTTFEITAVGGSGEVTEVRLRNSGCYSTEPANNGTGGRYDTVKLTGAGDDLLELDLTFSGNGWTINRVTQEVATATIGATAGTSYSLGDTIELPEGDSRSGYTAPQGTNKGILTTAVALTTGTALTVTDAGIFHRQPPTNEAVSDMIAGTGAGDMTVDLTFQEFTDTTTDIEVIMTGAASTVGIRSYDSGAGVTNFEIMGAQVYGADNDWDAQVNQSPGRYPDGDDGSYVVSEDEAFSYFLSVTDRRIVCVMRLAAGIYSNFYLGSFDPYATATEHPDPTLVLGCTSNHGLNQGSAANRWAGMNLCIGDGALEGPGAVLNAASAWVIVQNGFASGANITKSTDFTSAVVIPGGDFTLQATKFEDQDQFLGDILTSPGSTVPRWAYWCLTQDPDGSGITAFANDFRWSSMGTEGGDEFPVMWECTVLDMVNTNPAVLGELDGVKQIDQRVRSGSTFLGSEDEMDDDTDFWYVFNNCRLTDHWTYFAMRGS